MATEGAHEVPPLAKELLTISVHREGRISLLRGYNPEKLLTL